MTEQGQGVAQPPYPREPNVHSGGKQEPGGDRPLPPYDKRQMSGKDQDELVEERGGAGSAAGPRNVSQAERQGVSDTAMSPSGPHGVGESPSTSGNEQALTDSEASRRSDRLDTGVSREENVDPESPAMHSGDQGG
jgi:hypothetical protein